MIFIGSVTWIGLILGIIGLIENIRKEGFYLLIIPKSFRVYICITLAFDYLLTKIIILYEMNKILIEGGVDLSLEYGWKLIFIQIDGILRVLGFLLLILYLLNALGKIKK